MHVRVLTYNIRKGKGGLAIGGSALKPLRDAIRRVGADIVFLQEVRGHSKRKSDHSEGFKGDQLEYLADTVWHQYAYGKNAVTDLGHHGNAILSKFPIVTWENVDISTNRMEKRGLLHAVIEMPNQKKLDLICLHLNLFESGRRIQLRRLTERIRSFVPKRGPLLVAGDFNDWRGRLSNVLREELELDEVALAATGRHARTFPAWLPILPLDRIYFRDLELKNLAPQSEATWRLLSDHQALLAEFKLART